MAIICNSTTYLTLDGRDRTHETMEVDPPNKVVLLMVDAPDAQYGFAYEYAAGHAVWSGWREGERYVIAEFDAEIPPHSA